MITIGNLSPRWMQHALPLVMLTLLADVAIGADQLYKAGQIVTNNIAVYARKPFTNLVGRVFPRGSAVHLSDFAGYVIFCEFFDPT